MKEQVREAIVARGYSNFHLMDVNTIKHIAVGSFNGLCMRLKNDADFELKFCENAERLLKRFHHIQLENELTLLEKRKRLSAQLTDD